MSAVEHRNAGDLDASWIGRTVTINTHAGPFTGGLSDFEILTIEPMVLLYIGGRTLRAAPQATVTSDSLGVIGGAL